ncbi:MAG: anaerobic glycerol-3-phosphate dehydrogenase subunit B [Acidimicrobiia bacterium]|nr:anaerobic glycerol-3-phosphate dehydrogenase subunit B [Acidimicrobiia bacterium]
MRTVVIGAGLAGLTVAARLQEQGAEVEVVAKGWGALHWHAGTIDVLGVYDKEMVDSPAAAVPRLIGDQPHHPYALAGADVLSDALAWLITVTDDTIGLTGDLESNHVLISGTGGPRPTCLAPRSMLSGQYADTAPTLIVGLDRFPDFASLLVASNINEGGGNARAVDVAVPGITDRTFLNGVTIAHALDDPTMMEAFIKTVRPYLGSEERVGFPAVLGLRRHRGAFEQLQTELERPIFEIPIIPPSVPGMRIHQTLRARIGEHKVLSGRDVTGVELEGDRITEIVSEAAGSSHRTPGDRFVLATGGILGGGIVAQQDGTLEEVVAGLPVTGPDSRFDWFHTDFTHGHPVYRSGVAVNGDFSVADGPSNMSVVGHTLGQADTIREKSLEGVALATAYRGAGLLTEEWVPS